jgi:hypothetical protein
VLLKLCVNSRNACFYLMIASAQGLQAGNRGSWHPRHIVKQFGHRLQGVEALNGESLNWRQDVLRNVAYHTRTVTQIQE